MHTRVQGLDTAVHHLGKTGQVADRPGIDRGIQDRAQRAPGCIQLVAQPLQAAGEGAEPGLVANGQQSSWQVAPPSTEWPWAEFDAPLRGLARATSPACRRCAQALPPG